ncbi:MAG: hypothetical protein WBM32_02390 [Crocosphaera sp.]|jgi:hypothetical protein
MKTNYDFSQGEQGKFYDPNAKFYFPIYLEPDIEAFITELAQEKGVDVNVLVNELLRSNIKVIEMLR